MNEFFFFLSISLCRPNIPKFILFWFFFPLFSLFSILSRSQSKFITIKPSVKTESIIFYLEMLMKIWFDLLSHKWGKRKLIKAKRKIHYLACDSFTEEKKINVSSQFISAFETIFVYSVCLILVFTQSKRRMYKKHVNKV